MRTEYLLNREVDLILDLLTVQNRLVLETALYTGLRIGDVLALKPEQLKPRFTVKEQKTGKKRITCLSNSLLDRLRENSGMVWVFPGRDPTKHRTRQAVWKDMKRAAKAMRLDVNAAPHSIRKVYAVRLLQKYGSLEKVRKALNHDSVEVTLLYAMADKAITEGPRRKNGG